MPWTEFEPVISEFERTRLHMPQTTRT